MFRRSKKRIVAAILLSLILFLGLTLGAVYASSWLAVTRQNREMLSSYVEMRLSGDRESGAPVPGEMPSPPDGREPDGKGGPGKDWPGRKADEPFFRLSTFYAVTYDADGQVTSVENTGSLYTEDELTEAAGKAAGLKNAKGRLGSLLYQKEETANGGLLVAFMDNTVSDRNLVTVLRNTLLAGGIGIGILFFVSWFLAGRIVKPLEENDRRQKQFVSDAGHELKTPVSVIAANAELLKRDVGANEWLSNIVYENERMGTLVKELLDLSRAENAQPVRERVDFSRLVMGEALPFESVAFEKGKQLETRIAEGIFVEGNSTQLKQLTAILLDNAMEHADGDGGILLECFSQHRSAVLKVTNPGKPIPPEQREHLFERFYRMDEARSGEDRHYGLGLAIARAIAEAHRGQVAVECADGKVSFLVTIPAVK